MSAAAATATNQKKLFRAPLICWHAEKKFLENKPFVINTTGCKISKAFEKLDGENVMRTFLGGGSNLSHVRITQDYDTDSTPMARRSLYRRIARKTIIYADIYYNSESLSESEVEKKLDEMFKNVTFHFKTLHFKIASTDFDAADFLGLAA